MSTNSFQKDLQKLTGEQLSAVTFVQDYIQLDFDGIGFNIYMPIEIEEHERKSLIGETNFRNTICNLIGEIVKKVEHKEKKYVKLIFNENICMKISLLPSDFTGPEAMSYHDRDGNNFILN